MKRTLRKNLEGERIESTKYELIKLVAERFNGKENELALEPPKLAAISCDGREPYLVEIGESGIVRHVSENQVKDKFIKYCADAAMHRYGLTVQNAEQAFRVWKATANILDEKSVADVLFADDSGLCWQRLPWSRLMDWPGDTPSPTPVWDEILGRMSDPEIFLAYIGSMFWPQADRQQYLWITGEGGDGKGSITRALARLFGPVFATLYEPSRDDRFWNYQLIGKRCVVMAESNRTTFVMSAKFKSLTGGDHITIEPKGKDTFSVMPRAKFIVTSNNEPTAARGAANDRRMLLIHLEPLKANCVRLNDTQYGEMLWDEMPYLVMRAHIAYDRLCPNHGAIVNTEKMKEYQELARSEHEMPYETLFEKYFILDKEDKIKGTDLGKIMAENKKDQFWTRDFYQWMHTKFGIKKIKTRSGVWYQGIKINPNHVAMTF